MSKVVLAVLSQGAWRATRQHARETQNVNARNATNAARVVVKVTECAEYKDVLAAQQAIYAAHQKLTLQGAQDGMRILPRANLLKHSDAMRAKVAAFDAALERFWPAYEREALAAPTRLGGLYDPAAWPSLDRVQAAFYTSTRYLEAPVTGAWADYMAEALQAAEFDVMGRVREALEKAQARLSSAQRLYATVGADIDAAADLAAALDSPALAPVTKALAPLIGMDIAGLRDNDKARQALAKQAGDILATIGGAL